jgi:acetyltransferase-like isoleucine patch superfamily enzyme
MTPVFLFGVGSPIIVDVEETCRRAGWPIGCGIQNVSAPVHTSDAVPIQQLRPGLILAGPVLLPLFSPSNRRFAWHLALTLHAADFPSLIDPTSILPRRIDIQGGVYINAGCTLGAGAVILPGIRIGAGVVVDADVPPGAMRRARRAA